MSDHVPFDPRVKFLHNVDLVKITSLIIDIDATIGRNIVLDFWSIVSRRQVAQWKNNTRTTSWKRKETMETTKFTDEVCTTIICKVIDEYDSRFRFKNLSVISKLFTTRAKWTTSPWSTEIDEVRRGIFHRWRCKSKRKKKEKKKNKYKKRNM